ncbi:hypothetical protein [Mycobacterium sp. D16Q16]|uniref:hypothetical protein n=1 Tax=Mycobacterium sp. D16Q16 TaxID=1855659 RepID=UPI0011175211|nr:hypothetical protein [Mycobacterium sp. D16Q16]
MLAESRITRVVVTTTRAKQPFGEPVTFGALGLDDRPEHYPSAAASDNTAFLGKLGNHSHTDDNEA